MEHDATHLEVDRWRSWRRGRVAELGNEQALLDGDWWLTFPPEDRIRAVDEAKDELERMGWARRGQEPTRTTRYYRHAVVPGESCV
jgi:hypothetical protein